MKGSGVFGGIGLIHVMALLLLAAGCGSRDIVPVSGRVTLAGQPLAGATVTFQPVHDAAEEAQAATGSVGRTDAQGRYRLRLVDPDREGARVGTHVVTITTASSSLPADDAAAPVGEHVPPRWRDGSQRFTVPPEGTATADFELSEPSGLGSNAESQIKLESRSPNDE